MRNPARCLAQLTGAVALMAGTYTFALTVPARSLSQPQRTAAGVLVLWGVLLAPAVLIVGAARDSQP